MLLTESFQIGIFDLDHHDPLMLSSIIGEVVVGCWFMEDIFHAEKSGNYFTCFLILKPM